MEIQTPNTDLPSSTPKIYHRQAGFFGPNAKDLKAIFDPNTHFPFKKEEKSEDTSLTEGKEEEKEEKELIPGANLKKRGCAGVYLGEICVKTGEGIAEMLDTLSLYLNASQEVSKINRLKNSRQQCGIGDCIIM